MEAVEAEKRPRSEESTPKDLTPKKAKTKPRDSNISEDAAFEKVAIVPEGYPKFQLEQSKHDTVLQALMQEYVKIPQGNKVVLTRWNSRPGHLLLTCANKDSSNWVKEVVPSLRPWEGCSLKALTSGKLPNSIACTAFVPEEFGVKIDARGVLKRLDVGNPEFDTSHWRVLGESAVDKGQVVTFSMDEISFQALQKLSMNPRCGFGRIKFRVRGGAGSQDLAPVDSAASPETASTSQTRIESTPSSSSAQQLALQQSSQLMPATHISSSPVQSIPVQSVYSTGTDSFDRPMLRMMANHPEASNDSSSKHESNDTDICVEIKSLPLHYVSYSDIRKFFSGLTIPPNGIKMINDAQGNKTGIAYVKFSTSAQKKSALNKNGKKIRSNVVEVLHLRDDIYKAAVDNYKPGKDSIIKEVDMDIDNEESKDVKDSRRDNRSTGREKKFQDSYRASTAMDYSPANRGGDRSEREPLLVERQEKMDRPPRCDRPLRIDSRRMDRQEILEMSNSILIKNLPEQCNERDILDFFSELGTAPLNIHLMRDNVTQLGKAYCQFENNEEANKATIKDRTKVGRLVVSVEKVSADEFDKAVGIWEPPPPHPARRMYDTLTPRLPIPPENQYRSAHYDEKESNTYGMNDRNGGRLSGNNSGPMRGPLMPGSLKSGPSGTLRSPYAGENTYIDGNVVDTFGKPGCVIALENLHYRADVDEIIRLFSNFDVVHEDVIRRFDERGRPTGDARVSLKSPTEAMRAVRELQYSQLRGKTIKMFLLQS